VVFSRHAKNEMRLYSIDKLAAESVVRQPIESSYDRSGNLTFSGRIADGRLLRVVVAIDDPGFVITLFPVRE